MNKILELNTAAVHTRDGLLYQGDTMIPVPEADRVANVFGFVHAEDMVQALQAEQGMNAPFIAEARACYADGSDNDVEVDDNAKVNIGEDGTWVSAWVWLAKEDSTEFEPDPEMRQIMEHTARRAANQHYCGDSYEMRVLVQQGLMKPIGRKSFVPDPYFTLTAEGHQYLTDVWEDERDG
jgi:hypothetical protein